EQGRRDGSRVAGRVASFAAALGARRRRERHGKSVAGNRKQRQTTCGAMAKPPPRQGARGMKPGTPVFTTLLYRTFVVMLARISFMAQSGRADRSKYSRIRAC